MMGYLFKFTFFLQVRTQQLTFIFSLAINLREVSELTVTGIPGSDHQFSIVLNPSKYTISNIFTQ